MKLNILSGGAAQGLVAGLTAQFRATSRYDVAGTFGAIGAMKERLLAGTPVDLVILSSAMVEQLVSEGRVARGATFDLGAVPTGIAVRASDPLTAVGDESALREALMAADAIYLPDPAKATAGVHFVKVLARLGVGDQLTPRLRPFPHGQAAMAAMALHAGGNPIGCTQATEILATSGVTYAGPLPPGFELSTTYTAGVVAGAEHPDAARLLAEMMAAPGAAKLRAELGFVS